MRSCPLVGCSLTRNDSVVDSFWVPALAAGSGATRQNSTSLPFRWERRATNVYSQDVVVRPLPTPIRPSPSVESLLASLGGLPPLHREEQWRQALEAREGAAPRAMMMIHHGDLHQPAHPPLEGEEAAAVVDATAALSYLGEAGSVEPVALLRRVLKRKVLDAEDEDEDEEDEEDGAQMPTPGRSGFKRPFPFVSTWPPQKRQR